MGGRSREARRGVGRRRREGPRGRERDAPPCPIRGRVVVMSEPQTGANESLRLHVGAFDGPLDLLLHLVRINEVDITNIPILEIAAQYDAYLSLMRELDL